jgi:pimeloyl-ACP methyl ester carboxylesterase
MSAIETVRTANRVLGAIAPGAAAHYARKLLMTPRRRRERDYERAAVARGERITFRFGLGGVRWGHAGPLVVLLHGWEGRPGQFAALVEPLLASGRQVVALEAPAHGRSPGREAHPVAFAEALLDAAVELKPIEAVIGHSMGGAAAFYAAHLGLPLERLVTIGAPSAMHRVLDLFADWIALEGAARERFRALVDRHVGVRADELDVARIGPALDLPGLVVHDRDDGEVPYADAERIVAGWPGARLHTTQGLGHNRVLADPGVVAAVLAFLAHSRAPALRAA